MAGKSLKIIQSDETIVELQKVEDKTKELVIQFGKLVKVGNEVNKLLKKGTAKEYAAGIKQLKTATEDFNKAQKKMAENLTRVSQLERQVAQLLRDQSRAIRDVANATRDESRAREADERVATQQQRTAREAARTLEAEQRARRETANALSAESRERVQATREAERNARANSESTEAYKRFSREVLEAKNKAKNLGAEMIFLEQDYRRGAITSREYNTQMNRLTREFTEARTRAAGLHNQIRTLDASVGDHQRNVGNYRSALNGLTTSFRNLIGAFGVVGAMDMFADLMQSSFRTIKVLNAQNVALNQIFETQAQVSYQQQFLTEISDRYGLELVKTTDSYTKYSAAVKDTALEGENARKIFTSFSGASAKLGLNAETQTGIFRALEQMISKGTVQAEELRGQLGDRMPGAFKLFADAAGVSTSQLGNMLKKGEVMASDILPKVAAKLDETYNLSKSEKIDTVVAAQNRLSNSWTAFLSDTAQDKEILNGLAIGMEGLGDVINFLLDTLIVKGTDGVSVLGDLIETIESLYDAVTGMASALGLMDEKTKSSLFSMNQFKNDLKSMQAVIGVVTGTVKALAETISAFFETLFQDDGWDKFTKRFEDADTKLRNLYSSYNKTQDGIMAANKKGMAYNNELDPHIEAWKKAKEAKQAYFQLNGKYFDTKTGRNTGKSLDDYIDVGNTLKLKEKTPLDLDSGKKEKYKASKLTGEQRDAIKRLEAFRDIELSTNEKAFIKGGLDQVKYLEESLRINTNFFHQKMSLLKGSNAEEKKQRADAELDQLKMQKDTQKKIFDIESKRIDESYKKNVISTDRRSKFFDNSDFYDSSGRLESEISLTDEMISNAENYYKDLIEKAKKSNQETLEIERKRDDEIGNLQDARSAKIRSRLETYIEDLNKQSDIITNTKILSIEEERSLILSNKKLTNSEKSFALSILEKKNQIELNDLEIKKLIAIKNKISAKEYLTQEDEKSIAELTAQIKVLENSNISLNIDIKADISDKTKAIHDIVTQGFKDLGFEGLGDSYAALMDRLKGETGSWKDYAILAASAVLDALSNLTDKQKEKRLAALDEELESSQKTTEQEIGFVNDRLAQLNSLQELTAEQMTERNRLEDEARTYKEQQLQREKLIEIQKAKAEQKAAAQKALINGALAATTTLAQLGFAAGAIPAALALGFGIAQSVAIMAKDPVPKYFVGRQGGRAEYAITQDGGRELITNSKGEIKSLGSDKGDQLTWLDQGDNVHTAKETKSILSKIGVVPKIGDNIFQKIALQSLRAPAPVVVSHNVDNSDMIAEKVGREFDKALKRYDKPVILKKQGRIIEYRGANIGNVIGEYDENGNEKYYS